MPDGKLYKKGLRRQLNNLFLIYKTIKKHINSTYPNSTEKGITLNLKDPAQFKSAKKIFILLGAKLLKSEEETFSLEEIRSTGIVDYFRFLGLDLPTLERQINKTNRFYFNPKHSLIEIPWSFEFLNKITGLNLKTETFFQELVRNERFSLFLGIFFNLSEAEIQYIHNLSRTPNQSGWNEFYRDKQKLIGMFLLSKALRVYNNTLLLPGGEAAEKLWEEVSGVNPRASPLKFLKTLCSKGQGKLVYTYIFSFFMPEDLREQVMLGYNGIKFKEILRQINLKSMEKIDEKRLPQLHQENFFKSVFALKIRNNVIWLPPGPSEWLRIFFGSNLKGSHEDQVFELLKKLAGATPKDRRRFVSIYTKFHHRSDLQTSKVLKKCFDTYDEFNIMLDFIEKIPVKNPDTFINLLDWAESFQKLPPKEFSLYVPIFQSLLEIMGHRAKYDPHEVDFDKMLNAMMEISRVDNCTVFENCLNFLKIQWGIILTKENADESMINHLLKGINNSNINIKGAIYRFRPRDIFKDVMEKIMETQELCPLNLLADLNHMLNNLQNMKLDMRRKIQKGFYSRLDQIPHPGISPKAPSPIKDRVLQYSTKEFDKDSKKFEIHFTKETSAEMVRFSARHIKGTYFLPHLKDYLLTLAYTINAKNQKLKGFLNPNLIRLHDFDREMAWKDCTDSNQQSRSKKHAFGQQFSGYYFRGGISRLDSAFLPLWKRYFFPRNLILDPSHIQAILLNILDLYPIPAHPEGQEYISLLTELGLELIRKSIEIPELKSRLIKESASLLVGFHYRNLMEYFNGKNKDFHLYFYELYGLGERCSKSPEILDYFSSKGNLEKYLSLNTDGLRRVSQMNKGISYSSFGNVIPQNMSIFPAGIGVLFTSGVTSGEMMNEFKISCAYYMHKKKLPMVMMGYILYNYIHTIGPIYSQNHRRDHFSSYFLFSIFNQGHINHGIRKLKEKGFLRIQ